MWYASHRIVISTLRRASCHAGAALHRFDEVFRFFKSNTRRQAVEFDRLDLLTGPDRLRDPGRQLGVGIEFDVSLAEQEVELGFDPRERRDAGLKRGEASP